MRITSTKQVTTTDWKIAIDCLATFALIF